MPTIDLPISVAAVRQLTAVPSMLTSMATPFVSVGWLRASNFLMTGVAAFLKSTKAMYSPAFAGVTK